MNSTFIRGMIVGLSLLASCWANNVPHKKFEWKSIDFKYPTPEERQAAIDKSEFIPANVIPVGMDVSENRLFLSLPRLKPGVPASLATINLNESNVSPALTPYPSWQSFQAVNAKDVPDIVSPFHIKIDRCQRLWVVDTGAEGIAGSENFKSISLPSILIFNLRDDTLIRRYTLPENKLDKSVFSNIVVDDNDCDDTFAYVADAGTPPSLIVYSFKSNTSSNIKHNFFHMQPLDGNFSILGQKYHTEVALYGLALTEKKANGYPDLFFHALTGTTEFNVSTEILRNMKPSDNGFYQKFNKIGDRAVNEQAGATVYDPSQKVFFYTLPNKNEIGCWKATSNYSVSNVFESVTQMVYPIDIKIDNMQQVWILSNRMHEFLNTNLDIEHETNFRVQYIPAKEAVKNTKCETGAFEHIKNAGESVKNKIFGKNENNIGATKSAAFVAVIASISLTVMQLF